MNIEMQLHCQPSRDGKNGRLKRPIKELSQFDNINPEELSLTILMRLIKVSNIMDLYIVYKQLLDGYKPCNTTLSLTQYQRED